MLVCDDAGLAEDVCSDGYPIEIFDLRGPLYLVQLFPQGILGGI